MSSIYEEIIKRIDSLTVEIAALKITEGAGTAGGAISGSGTTGRITQWAGASSLTDSTLIKTGVGVLTITSDTDYTLTADTTGTIQTKEDAATTYLKLDGSNDPMTGGLAIVGGANEVQFAVTAANGQAAHLMTVNDSSNATTFWFNNGGSPFVENKNFTFINSAVPIDAYRSGNTSTMRFSTYTDNTTNGGRISLRGAGGTFASPTDMLNNYIMGEMQWFGYVNGAHRQGFLIRASMVNTISSTSYASNAYFILTLQGATTGTTVMTLHNNGYVGVNTGTGAPLGMLGIVARAATDIGLSVKGAASQSGDLFRGLNSSSTVLALIDAVGGAVFNENGDAAGDFRVESDTEVNMLFLDANGNTDGTLYLGGSTNGVQIDKGGDIYFIGTGAGLPYGSMYGVEIAQVQASAAQNTWYVVNDTDITDGPTNLVTGDGAGKLTVTKAGTYHISWDMTFEVNANNKHILGGIAINGTAQVPGQSHTESITNQELVLSGHAILALTAAQYVQVCFRTTDTGTPTISIDDVNLTLFMVGS